MLASYFLKKMPAMLTGRHDLAEARELLAYWEGRARGLPWHAIRQRREARTLARRWRARVAEAERARYGGGLLGAVLLVACERRLPEPFRQARLRAARWTARAFAAAVLCAASLTILATVATIDLLRLLLS
jgi:hypothetical protein